MGIETAIRVMRDNVVKLTSRVAETKRQAVRNPPEMGFEERGGPFIRTITQTVRSNTTKPLKLSYSGDGEPHLFLDSFKSYTCFGHDPQSAEQRYIANKSGGLLRECHLANEESFVCA